VSDEGDIPQISMTNTKKEMLAAYEEMRKQLKARPDPIPDPAVKRQEEEKRVAVETADAVVEVDALDRIQALRLAIGRELNDLGAKLNEESQTYREIKQAVAAKKAELKHVFEVETAAVDLAALLEAHRERKLRFESESAEARSAWERERSERQSEMDVERKGLEKKRSWEAEEFTFALKREQARKQNQLEDEMADLERQVRTLREEAERTRGSVAAEFAERETALARREECMAELEALAEGQDAALGAVRKSAISETEERLTAVYSAKETLLSKEFEGQRNVFASRIDALESLVEQQKAQIETLSRQQEMAYEKLQDIASKAVEGARREQAGTIARSSTKGKAKCVLELKKAMIGVMPGISTYFEIENRLIPFLDRAAELAVAGRPSPRWVSAASRNQKW
jgi:chromosome segregation ATPase